MRARIGAAFRSPNCGAGLRAAEAARMRLAAHSTVMGAACAAGGHTGCNNNVAGYNRHAQAAA